MLKKVSLTVLIAFFVISASAISFRLDSYLHYVGDVDGDGIEDLFLSARDKFIFLNIEVITPVAYQDGPDYLLPGNQDGSYGDTIVWDKKVDLTHLELSDFKTHLADVDGNGVKDLLLQSSHVDRDSVVLYGGSDKSIIGSYSFNQINGEYASLDYGATWTLQDINGDGKTDIVLNKGSGDQTVGVSKGIGGFYIEEYGTPSYVSSSNEIVVGATPGEINVNGSSGSVSYSFPINVPVGPGGVSPSISVDYSNMGGDTELGKGFRLSGFGKISRCPTNAAIEGYKSAPGHGYEHTFCIDGQRLVAIDSARREYRTRVDSISKVISKGGGWNNPKYFEIYYKSGEKEVYGEVGKNAQISHGSNIVNWLVSRKQDKMGNGYDIFYYDQNDDVNTTGSVDFIKYRNTHGVGNSENIKIDFVYSERGSASKRKMYQQGRLYYRRSVLESIRSSVDERVYRTYSFRYGAAPVSNYMRLESVQECGADGTCFNPTEIAWNDFKGDLNFNKSVSVSTEICADTNSRCEKSSIQYADLNGDGNQDVCYRDKKAGIICKLSSSKGFATGDKIETGICKDGFYDGGISCNDDDNHSTIKYMDFDHDGKDDLLYRTDKHGMVVYKSTGAGFERLGLYGDVCKNGSACRSVDRIYTYTPDLNGDGQTDFCWIDHYFNFKCTISNYAMKEGDYTGIVNLITFKQHDLETIHFPDIDGDGDQDLLFRRGASHSDSVKGLVAYRLNFSDKQRPKLDLYAETDVCVEGKDKEFCDNEGSYSITVGNVNGDAYDDVCFRGVSGVNCLISTGVGFDSKAFSMSTSGSPNSFCGSKGKENSRLSCDAKQNSMMLVDFNGDGLDDLFYRSVSGPVIALSNGSSFLSSNIGLNVCDDADENCDKNSLTLLDANDDGYADFVYRSSGGVKVHFNKSLSKRYLSDSIHSITNGHGLKQSVEYTTMFDADVYVTRRGNYNDLTKEKTLAPMSMPLVKQVRTTTVGGREAITHYRYKDYVQVMDVLGGSGFRESESFKSYADGKGFKAISRYHVKFPLSGNVYESLEYYKNLGGSWVIDTRNLTRWGVRAWDNSQGKIYSVVNEGTQAYEYSDSKVIKWTVSENFFNGESSHQNKHGKYMFNDVTKQTVKVYARQAAWTGDYNSESEIYFGIGKFTRYIDYPHTTLTTTSRYKPGDFNSWILGRLEHTTVTKKSWDNKSTTRSSNWTYSSNGLLESETFAPGTEYEKKTSYKYNRLGQKTQVVVEPLSGKSSVTSYIYNDGYLYQTKNDKGHGSYIIRHDVLGLPETTIDINGFFTTYDYDGFGRQTRMITPSGLIKETHLSEHLKHFSGTRYAKTVTTNMGGMNRVYLDKSGYKLGTASRGADGIVRYQKYDHNDIGMAVRTYVPSKNFSDFTAHSGIDAIDQKLRVTQTHDSRGGVSSVQYEAYKKTIVNPKGQKKTEYIRPDGKTIKVVQGLDHIIYYEYDVDGNLVGTTSEGTTISNRFDKFGHRVEINDPDKGKWKYTYNALDQMVMQENAKGYKTCFVYDSLGRMVQRYEEYTGSAYQARQECSGHSDKNKTSWHYDVAELGSHGSKYKGALSSVVNADGYAETYFYDNQGRSIRVDRKVKGITYTELNDYDQFSRLYSHTYPSGLRVRNHYSPVGALTKVSNFDSNFTYWQISGYDNLGRVNKSRLGNGLYQHTVFAETHSAIDQQVVSRNSSLPKTYSTSNDRLWLEYEYDEIDNYTLRKDVSLGLTESFEFDYLNRMEKGTLRHGSNIVLQESMRYQRNGNIEFKPGTGTYTYAEACSVSGIPGTAPAGPHAVSSVSLNGSIANYCYDKNGNMIADSKRRLYYANTYDKPLRITHENGAEVEFSYNHNRGRYYRRDVEKGNVTETFYASSGYEKVIKNVGELKEIVLEKHYIGGSVVEIHTNGNAQVPDRRYLHKDNLGSVVMITDSLGKVIERHNFDPWGEKRDLKGMKIPEYLTLEASAQFAKKEFTTYKSDVNGDGREDLYIQSEPNWVLIARSPSFLVPQVRKAWLYLGKADGTYEAPVEWFDYLNTNKMKLVNDAPLRNETTQMGFTGHEQLDSVGLVHMGGRLYDPKLGRMLNADPFVQAPANSQSFNRYSYVMNNPISLVDPSGYLWNPIKKLTKAVSRLGSYVSGRFAQLDDWQRQYTDQFGQWFRQKVAENPQTFAILQSAACISAGPIGCAVIQGVTTGVLTKDFKAGVKAFAIAAATPEAGGSGWSRVVQGAAISGISAKLSGADKPWRSAVFGGASAAFAEFTPKSWKASASDGYAVHAVQGAILSGTRGVVMGGGTQGFINGARSGAFLALYKCDIDPTKCGGDSGKRDYVRDVFGFGKDVTRKTWNLPNTMVGLAVGGLGYVVGLIKDTNPSIDFINNAIEFYNNPLVLSGITMGNTISYAVGVSPGDDNTHFVTSPAGHTVGREEYYHTLQGEILGPLYFPAHIIGGVSSYFRSPHPKLKDPKGMDWWHKNNFMETGPMQGRTF